MHSKHFQFARKSFNAPFFSDFCKTQLGRVSLTHRDKIRTPMHCQRLLPHITTTWCQHQASQKTAGTNLVQQASTSSMKFLPISDFLAPEAVLQARSPFNREHLLPLTLPRRNIKYSPTFNHNHISHPTRGQSHDTT